MRCRHRRGPAAGADADTSQAPLAPLPGLGRRLEHRILIRAAHRGAVWRKHMEVGAAAESTGRERRHQVAGVEVLGHARTRRADDDSLPPRRPVRPVRRGPLRAQNEDQAVVHRTVRHHATAGPLPRLVEHLDPACGHLHAFDARAVEDRAVGGGTDVVGNPPRVGRPDAAVGEHVAMRGSSDLMRLGHGDRRGVVSRGSVQSAARFTPPSSRRGRRRTRRPSRRA